MESVLLFLDISKPGLDNDWTSQITASLKKLPSIDQVQVIEENEHCNAQISISYDVQELLINEIERVVTDSCAYITDINIQFPSSITGIVDPYGASAISIIVEENLKRIEGVLGGTISASGKLKVVLDTTAKNKQSAIKEILIFISSLRSGKR